MAQTQTQIASDLIAGISTSTSAATNFNPGSLIRALADAFSAESAMIEAQVESQVATGIVNAVYQALGVTPDGAVGSTYLLTFALASSATSSVTLASGTAATIPGSSLQWKTSQSVTIAPGGSQSVTATCTTTGTNTNVPASTITQLVSPVANVTVNNASAQPVVSGRDAQTQTELQAQVSNKINSLHKGDAAAIEAAALTSELTDASGNPTEQVVKALCLDSSTNGLAYCYIYNGTGVASSNLITQTQNIINGYTDTNGNKIVGAKPAGVTVTVENATLTTINVSLNVLPKYGYTLSTITGNVQTAVESFFEGLDIDDALSLAQLMYAILAAQGVADVQVVSPTSSQAANTNGTLYVLGTLTVNSM